MDSPRSSTTSLVLNRLPRPLWGAGPDCRFFHLKACRVHVAPRLTHEHLAEWALATREVRQIAGGRPKSCCAVVGHTRVRIPPSPPEDGRKPTFIALSSRSIHGSITLPFRARVPSRSLSFHAKLRAEVAYGGSTTTDPYLLKPLVICGVESFASPKRRKRRGY